MFLALRDLRFGKGRFALMGAVVALISLLLVMLTGLTAGLGTQNTAAFDRLGSEGVDRLVFGGISGHDPEVSLTQSEITVDQQREWQDAAGVASADALGITQHRIETEAGVTAVSLYGIDPASVDAPDGLADGQIVIGEDTAVDLAIAEGDTVSVAGNEFTVAAVMPTDYSAHSPVVWVALEDWQTATHAAPDVLGTVLAVRFTDAEAAQAAAATSGAAGSAAGSATAAALDPDEVTSAANTAAHTVDATIRDSYAALPAYQSEHGSLTTMQGFLYGISALVVVAFVSIWTIQRTREIAVLKALGASTRWVLRDALIQSGMVLAVGITLGTAAAFGLGLIAQQAVPFSVTTATVAVPAAGMMLLGLLGSAVAVARTVRVEPLVALGGN